LKLLLEADPDPNRWLWFWEWFQADPVRYELFSIIYLVLELFIIITLFVNF
jgi:hypothetical protein